MTITPIRTQSASSTELEDLDRRHLIHPLQAAAISDRLVIVRGKGCAVWDADGNELLDATGGGLWHSHVGHGRRELAEAAAKQIEQLEYFTSYQEFTNDKAIELAVRLSGLAPADLNKVFFTSGGSESVETAIKAARLYHARRGQPDRTWIISRLYGYHGANYGSGTLTGFEPMHLSVGPNLPHVEKVSPPYLYRAAELYGDQDPTDFLINELEQTIERLGPGNVAAMIGEPVMGGGGVLTPPADYWPRVREVLNKHGILLIADEVITAFGRTGAWFDSAQRDMDPDIITTAKGITSGYFSFGAVLLRDGIGDAITEDYGFFHGYTFSGHPVGAAVALANLDIMEREDLPANALSIGDWFRAGLAPLADVPTVGDVRVEGAAAAIEMVADRQTREPMAFPDVFGLTAQIRAKHGVITRPYAHNIILSPPLTMNEDEVRRASAAIVDVLTQTAANG
ncbi:MULTISPECIES: aminotransferase family protein [Streptosporangium]|uniref:Putrescine aminotransferase n=1 Tax=Streptosporangium brasiliense TaxID=47480 RepID=A0ABT9RLW7_9ACTN|nr:aspartate aminotransferase family protein [Streptosporangium brasiliense]MDP9870286.1 putrescine aminotransferase [Streptosporangium brasiliense]